MELMIFLVGKKYIIHWAYYYGLHVRNKKIANWHFSFKINACPRRRRIWL